MFNTKPLLLIATFGLLIFFIVRIQPPAVLDTFFHLSLGREVAATRQIPTQDNFIYSDVDKTYTSTVWLSGLIFYTFVQLFGINGMLVLKAILMLGSMYFLYLTLRLFSEDKFKIASALLLVAYILAFRFNSRPEMISLMLLSFINFCYLHYYYKREHHLLALLLPLVFLTWPNIHGLVSIGLAIVGFFTLLILVEDKLVNIKRNNISRFYVTSALIAFVSLIQFERVFSFLHSGRFSTFVLEWADLATRLFPSGDFELLGHPPADTFIYLFFSAAYIALLAASVFLSFQKKSVGSYAVWIFYGVILLLSVRYFRLIQSTILLGAPILVLLISRVEEKFDYKVIYGAVYKFTFAVLFLFLFYCGLTFHLYGGEYESPRFTYPYGSEIVMKENLSSKRIFTTVLWDDYYLWNIPGVKTYSDILMDTKTTESIEIGKIMHENDPSALFLIDKYNVDTVVNTQSWMTLQNNTPVHTLPNWKLVYLNGTYIVYARDDVIKSRPFDLSAISPHLETPLKFTKEDTKKALAQLQNLLKYDPDNDFALGQQIIYYISDGNDIEKAKNMALAAQKQTPKNPWFSFYLAIIYDRSNDCEGAIKWANEALKISRNDNAVSQSISSSILNCSEYVRFD